MFGAQVCEWLAFPPTSDRCRIAPPCRDWAVDRGRSCPSHKSKARLEAMNQPFVPTIDVKAPSYVKHQQAIEWIAKIASLVKPDRVVWCDGSQAEYDRLCDEMVQSGTFKRLNPKLRPNCFLALSDPTD